MNSSAGFPNLPSFASAPSWLNRAGRVDRSACVEVRASDIWPHLSPDDWRPARSSTGRQARATFVLDSWLLQHFRSRALPRQLSGDWRTPKSNAMKWSHHPQRRNRKLKPSEQPWRAQPITGPILHGNPNKGAAAEKSFPCPKNPPPKNPPPKNPLPKKAQALQCPTSIPRKTEARKAQARKAEAWQCLGFTPWSQLITLERWKRIPKSNRQITRSPNHKIPRHQHWLICPKCKRKCGKLFQILATTRELIDALIAQRWIACIDSAHQAARKPMSPELIAARTQLLNRYAPLMGTRPMLCRHCLGMRYGEVKKSRRTLQPTHSESPPRPPERPRHFSAKQYSPTKRQHSRAWAPNLQQIAAAFDEPITPEQLEAFTSAAAADDYAAFIPSSEELESILRAFAIDWSPSSQNPGTPVPGRPGAPT